MVSLKQILEWFQTGLYPTEDQFKQTWLSYWHKSEKIPRTQIIGGSTGLFVEKLGINSLIYPKYFRYIDDMIISSVTLAGNAAGASFTVDGVDYTHETLKGITIPKDVDLIINDIDIAAGYDTGSIIIFF